VNTTAPRGNATPTRATVVVLHGVANRRWLTARLARRIAADGYAVHNLDYPSRTMALAELGDRWLPEQLAVLNAAQAPQLHFVTHSMGALLVRRFLAARRPANLGRIVMIAPPNHGSAVADRLRQRRFFRWLIGRNLAVLGTGPDAFWRSLPPRADFELGVIAGSRALSPLGRCWLDAPHDGTVAVASTHLEGQIDHLVLPANHTGILLRRDTAEQVVAFLRSGRFGRESTS